jgi:hypothetical protein
MGILPLKDVELYLFALNFPGESAMVQRAIPRKTRNKNAKKYSSFMKRHAKTSDALN